jgi:glucuronoarabinoxylan endo-1,4-beta-xylanase
VGDMQAMVAAGGKIYGSPWSPPPAYKTNNSVDCTTSPGNGALAFSSYGAYATWLANFVESLAAQSVPLYALSVQNEPDQCQGYDSAIWTSSQVDNFVKNNLGPTFASDSLSTLIFMPESGTYAQLTEGNGGGTCGTDSSCTVYVGGYNWHDYDATYSAPDSVNDTPYPSGWTSGKKYWETEAACLPGGPPWYPSFCAATSTSYTTSIADALQWAAVIDQRMAVDNANAWLYWLLYEPGEVDNEPLISDTTPYPQRAYMMGQYAHFVRPGMYRIDATHQPQSGVSVSAYQNTSANTLAIVATNYTGSAVAQTFNITNAPTFTSLTPTITSPTQSLATLSSVSLSGNGFTYTLPAQSITTFSGNSGAPTGSCPSGSPVAGNSKCYFIAANGSDSNNGTSESTPWLHAPGMPACSGICAAVQSSLGSGGTVQAGVGLIFRGGDTWHEGNSGATPYTGGSFNIIWSGGGPTVCQYEGTQTGCFYIGVDKNWFSGASWARPILTGDNEPSTTPVSSCSYQVPGSNQLFITSLNENSYIYLDSFEMTGMCFADTTPPSTDNTYIVDTGTGVAGQGMNLYNNVYIHGWSITTGTKVNSAIPCTLISGTFNGLQSFTQIVIDGSDSVPGGCSAGAYPSWYHLKDSIFRYTGEIAGQWCHDIHDTIWEHWFPPYYGESTGSGSWGNHPNTFECNADSSGNAPGQPANTPNVFYNNIIRHDDPSQAGAGAVHLWFCPTTIPEYWFNNLMYDVTGGNLWDYSGAPTYSCPYAGTGSGPAQYMFNNTLVDAMQPCYNTAYYYGSGPGDLINPLTVLNEHLVNTPFDSSSGTYANPACAGLASATNVAQTDASATAQAYTTGSSGTAGTGNTCANDSTKPCTPTANSNATVGAGGNEQTYCTYLAGFTSEAAIGTEAANACKYGTTDGCFYNSTTHSMSCPAQTAVTRPPSAAWDSGAYQFGSAPPGTPTASVSPSTLAFGSQTDSTTSGPLVVTIANTGTASLLFTGYGLTTGTQFAISANTCNSTYANSLPAGDSCTLSITFTPTSAGAKSDTLTLTNNSGGTAGTQQAVALSGTGISGPTWTYGTNVHNFSCSGSTAGTTITCAAVITLVSGQSLEGAVSAWNLNATATWNGISGDVALVHPLGCSATGTNAAQNFYSDLFYITSDAGATHTITVTLNSTASNWNMDLELVPVTISTGSAAFGGCGSVGYAASSPGCVSSPCVSPALTLSASSNAVLQAVALGYGPPATVPSVYTYDPDVGNVDAGFAWAPNLSAVTQITWDSTNAANYPAASVMALKPYTSPPAAPVHLTVVVSQ